MKKYIYSGVVIDDLSYVLGGNILLDAVVTSGAHLHVRNGGSAYNILLTSDSELYVKSGGVANNIKIEEGSIHIEQGASASVFYDPWQTDKIHSDPGANLEYLCVSGYVYYGNDSVGIVSRMLADTVDKTFQITGPFSAIVLNDAKLKRVTAINGGYLVITSAGMVGSAYASTNGSIVVSSSGMVDKVILNEQTPLSMPNGGTTQQGVINSHGFLDIIGGYVGSSLINCNGIMKLTSQGSCGETCITDGGQAHVDNSSILSSATVNSGGALHVSHYGSVAAATINSSGKVFVYQNGELKNGIINTHGYVEVFSSGNTQSTTIMQTGSLWVTSGGQASNTMISGGILSVRYGGTADAVSVGSSVESTTAGSPAWSTGDFKSRGGVHVSNGGVAKDVTVNVRGCVWVSSGGIASNVTLLSSGYMNVYGGGEVYGGEINNGTNVVWLHSGAEIHDFSVLRGGDLIFSHGCKGYNIYTNSGTIWLEGGYLSGGSSYNNGRIVMGHNNNALRMVPRHGSAYDLHISSGGTLEMHRGYASGVVMSSGGLAQLHSSSGIKIEKMLLNNGATVEIQGNPEISFVFNPWQHSATAANPSNIHIGDFNPNNGAGAHYTFNSTGYISSGQAYGGITWLARNKCVYLGGWTSGLVCSANTMSSLNINAGLSAIVYNSGYIENTTVQAGGQIVMSGGYACDTTVNTNGSMTMLNGSADLIHVGSLGYLNMFNGATANSVMLASSGRMNVYAGASALNVVLNSCTLTVENGGYVEIDYNPWFTERAVKAAAGATVVSENFDQREYNVYYGRTDYGLISRANCMNGVEAGYNEIIYTYANGLTENIFVNYGGRLVVDNGGMLQGKNQIASSGSLIVSSGGKVTGELYIASGGVVSAHEGAIIDFDISKRISIDKALINDLAIVKGAPEYTITVADNQNEGCYKLATGATNFSGSISVSNGTTTYGSVSLDKSLSYNGVEYSLTNVDGYLNLTIAAIPAQTVQNKFLTGMFDETATDMLVSVKDGNISIYNDRTVLTEFPLEYGWDIVGAADFNRDGKDDILRQNNQGLVVADLYNGHTYFTPQVLNSVSQGWEIKGTGNFNGNGSDDILIASKTAISGSVGILGYWESGTKWTLIDGYSPEWEMIATGDFNNDSKTDMLWRNQFTGLDNNTYNAYCTWLIDEDSNWRIVSSTSLEDWNFLCCGDFDGDGSSDIAMINSTGTVGIWGINNGYLNSWDIVSVIDLNSWQLASVGDFNGDGTDDIAWYNTENELVSYWQIKDKNIANCQEITTIP